MLLILIMLASAGLVNAAPFLICDPQNGVDTYNIYIDGTSVANDITAEPDGSVRYDLQGITPGQYQFTAEACNVWGCSEVSDPFVSPAATAKPSGLLLIK